jgi:sterol desaturase/sphingolipid hydroxylase (fatty acid hydroxylase superfamily)
MAAIVAGLEHAIASIASLFHDAHNSYHRLNPTLRSALAPIILLLKYGPPIFILERLSGAKTTQYKTAGFRQDLVYWFLYSGGIFHTLITIYVLGLLAPHLNVFDVKLLDFIPQQHYFLRAAIYYVIGDFIVYWMHRWQHSSKFLWAFHTTHHSQKNLSFITLNRFHPIEELLLAVFTYVPLLMLGATAQDWVPLILLYRVVVYLQHSQIRWRLGPLGKILVTPHFHAVHHSTDPAHYDRNFGGTLSVWDHCFGTAVEEQERPSHSGLPDVEMATVASTFLVPFRLAYEAFFPGREQVESAGDD